MAKWSLAQVSNPIKDILEIIPYTECLLDPILADKLLITLSKHNYPPSVCTAMLLLHTMSDAGLIDIVEREFPSVPGVLVILKRN